MSLIPDSVIQEILFNAQIEDVVGDYVRLKKRGANYVGLCPFHNEKTPSMMISPQKGIFKCFGCGVGGDSISFVKEVDNLSYPEALRKLAEKYNIQIPDASVDDTEQKRTDDEKESLFLIFKYATEWFEKNLWESEEGNQIGQTYFKERGFTKKTIQLFQLGYSKESFSAFTESALKAGYKKELLIKAGLVREKNEHSYDFFRGRVIFPIHNYTGKVVAFGGRILKSADNQPKYLNSPESIIYSKSKILYGISAARKSIREKNNCFLVEGYTDVLSLVQSGIENVVATAGTAMTEDQVRLIKRLSDKITLIYDGDAAGINAAKRGMDIILKEGLDVKVVILPDGEDPDSYVRQLGGDGFLNFIEKEASDFIIFLADDFLKREGKDPSSIAKAANLLTETIALISDPIKRTVYIRECSKKLDLPEDLLFKKIARIIRNEYFDYQKKKVKESERQEYSNLEEELLAKESLEEDKLDVSSDYQEKDVIRILLEFGNNIYDEEKTIATFIFEEINADYFKNTHAIEVYKKIKSQWDENKICPTPEYFYQSENKELKDFVIDIFMNLPEPSTNWSEKHQIYLMSREKRAENDLITTYLRFNLKVILNLCEKERIHIQEAEKSKNLEKIQEHLMELDKLYTFQKKYAEMLKSVILK